MTLGEKNLGQLDNIMPITFKHKGNFKNTERFLKGATKVNQQIRSILDKYGAMGVAALSRATPYDSGETARSWDYTIQKSNWGWEIVWTNSHKNGSANIAILLQYGHGTGTGGYVPPNDYVNPAMKPIFDKIADEIWKEVSRL